MEVFVVILSACVTLLSIALCVTQRSIRSLSDRLRDIEESEALRRR